MPWENTGHIILKTATCLDLSVIDEMFANAWTIKSDPILITPKLDRFDLPRVEPTLSFPLRVQSSCEGKDTIY